MEIQKCPQCGAAASPSDKNCSYCQAEFFVTSIAYLDNLDAGGVAKYLKAYKDLAVQNPESGEGLLGLGLCYLSMGTVPLAQKYFDQVIEEHPEISQAYYYSALTYINGKRVMSVPLKDIRIIENNLNLAASLDPDAAHVRVLMAMVRRDYYLMNGMREPQPGSAELIAGLAGARINKAEAERLFNTVKVEQPQEYLQNVEII